MTATRIVLQRSVLTAGSFVLALFAMAAAVAKGQAVSPAIVEYTANGGSQESHFDVTNDSLESVMVSIEAKSFTIGPTGTAVFRRLDEAVHLQLSATTLRLPPKQHRTIYYKVSAEALPAWFCIYSTFSGLPRRNGISVQLELPHTVYLLGKAKPQKEDFRFVSLVRRGNEIRGVLRNDGDNVARVLTLETADRKKKQAEGGFPLLPKGERAFVLSADENASSGHVRAVFAGFHVDAEAQ